MTRTSGLLAFANLLQTAHLCSVGKTYEEQENLVRRCRAEGRAFLASMPLRHRFRCDDCGVETGELKLYFEDPKQRIDAVAPPGKWGEPAGRSYMIKFSALHRMLSHSEKMPDELTVLLHDAKP